MGLPLLRNKYIYRWNYWVLPHAYAQLEMVQFLLWCNYKYLQRVQMIENSNIPSRVFMHTYMLCDMWKSLLIFKIGTLGWAWKGRGMRGIIKLEVLWVKFQGEDQINIYWLCWKEGMSRAVGEKWQEWDGRVKNVNIHLWDFALQQRMLSLLKVEWQSRYVTHGNTHWRKGLEK